MASMKKLGIECCVDKDEDYGANYRITVAPSMVANPKTASRYFRRVANAIVDDAEANDRLGSISVSIDDRYAKSLGSIVRELADEAFEGEEDAEDTSEAHFSAGLCLGGTVGFITGVILGYPEMAEYATKAATYLNDISPLLAPIAGLTQAVISLGGTAVAAIAGLAVGGSVGVMLATPSSMMHCRAERKLRKYKSIESALNRAERSRLKIV